MIERRKILDAMSYEEMDAARCRLKFSSDPYAPAAIKILEQELKSRGRKRRQ